MLFCAAAELGADDARSHRYIERLGALTLWRIGGYEQTVRKVLGALSAHATSLVAHNDYAIGRELPLVNILTVEHCAVYGSPLFGREGKKIGKRQVVNPHSQDCAHSSLNDFGVVTVGCRFRAENVAYAKPIGKTYYGA